MTLRNINVIADRRGQNSHHTISLSFELAGKIKHLVQESLSNLNALNIVAAIKKGENIGLYC